MRQQQAVKSPPVSPRSPGLSRTNRTLARAAPYYCLSFPVVSADLTSGCGCRVLRVRSSGHEHEAGSEAGQPHGVWSACVRPRGVPPSQVREGPGATADEVRPGSGDPPHPLTEPVRFPVLAPEPETTRFRLSVGSSGPVDSLPDARTGKGKRCPQSGVSAARPEPRGAADHPTCTTSSARTL